MGVEFSRLQKPRSRQSDVISPRTSGTDAVEAESASSSEARSDFGGSTKQKKRERLGNKKDHSDKKDQSAPLAHRFKRKVGDEKHWLFGNELHMKKSDGMNLIFRQLMNGFNAPIDSMLESGSGKVLDFSCKEGIWIIEMARMYPTTVFVGLDAHPPTDPKHFDASLNIEVLPANVSFQASELTAKLPFNDETFDYVVGRSLGSMIPGGRNVWKELVDELVRITKKGGYIELMDVDWVPHDPGPLFSTFSKHSLAFAKEYNIDPSFAVSIDRILESSFFLVDVKHDYVSCPLGCYDDAGDTLAKTVGHFMTTFADPLRERMGITMAEFESFKIAALEEGKRTETFFNIYYAYGMKTDVY